jgi:hypothetical protein
VTPVRANRGWRPSARLAAVERLPYDPRREATTATLGDLRPPVQGWRARLVGCWVGDGDTGSVYYAGALLPDGSPCLVRARVEIDSSPERLAPYVLNQWAVYAGEEALAWGNARSCARTRPIA